VLILSERVRDAVRHVVNVRVRRSDSTVVRLVGEGDSKGDVHETEDTEVAKGAKVGEVVGLDVVDHRVFVDSLGRLDLETLIARKVEVAELDVLRPRHQGKTDRIESALQRKAIRRQRDKTNQFQSYRQLLMLYLRTLLPTSRTVSRVIIDSSAGSD
jgi:hypothetical protein